MERYIPKKLSFAIIHDFACNVKTFFSFFLSFFEKVKTKGFWEHMEEKSAPTCSFLGFCLAFACIKPGQIGFDCRVQAFSQSGYLIIVLLTVFPYGGHRRVG